MLINYLFLSECPANQNEQRGSNDYFNQENVLVNNLPAIETVNIGNIEQIISSNQTFNAFREEEMKYPVLSNSINDIQWINQDQNCNNKLQITSTDDASQVDLDELNEIKSNKSNLENFLNQEDQKKEERRRSACNRERLRMKSMNDAFSKLRTKLPNHYTSRKRLSKIDCLR